MCDIGGEEGSGDDVEGAADDMEGGDDEDTTNNTETNTTEDQQKDEVLAFHECCDVLLIITGDSIHCLAIPFPAKVGFLFTKAHVCV